MPTADLPTRSRPSTAPPAALLAAASIAIASASASARATDVLVTNFDAYAIGNLGGQVGFAGPAGTWATSGATNSPFVAASVIGPGTVPGVDPVGGTGRMVRLVTERFTLGRSKAWLDLLNSGQWAAASAGGNSVLETRVKLLVPGQQRVTSTFGIMISRSSSETSGGFVVSAQTGAISLLNGGYAAANRVATGVAATLDQWNEFVYRWNAANGEGSLSMNGAIVATHVTSGFGGVYASNLLSTSDSTPGSANAFGYFDDLSIAAVPPAAACPADLDGSGAVDAGDLATLLAAWGTPGGDVDGDGGTSATDLAALLAAWGGC